MRGKKRYTNTTFTRRVDHHGGEHRGARKPAEPRLCPECGAAYSRSRWWPAGHERARMLAGFAEPLICPACDMKRKHLARGYLTLEGTFFRGHRAEIEALLRNEENRAIEDNPTGRILDWERARDEALTVVTSTEHLAERLGHAMERAYGGTFSAGFSHENKLARAHWRRD